MQKRGLDLWHGRDFFAPTPFVRQPLFETSDFCNPIYPRLSLLLLWGPNDLHTHNFIIWELISNFHRTSATQGFLSAAEKRGLWEGVVQEPLRRALFCVFLCSEVIFSCKSHRNFFQKLPHPMQAFSGKPPREKPQNAAADSGRNYLV